MRDKGKHSSVESGWDVTFTELLCLLRKQDALPDRHFSGCMLFGSGLDPHRNFYSDVKWGKFDLECPKCKSMVRHNRVVSGGWLQYRKERSEVVNI